MPVRKVYPRSATQEESNRQFSTAINEIIDSLPLRVSRGVSSAGSADIEAGVYLCDASGGAFSLTLPAVASFKYRSLCIKKVDGSGNAVTVDGSGSETIDGAATYALSSQYAAVTVYSDGDEWHITATV